MFRKLNIKGVSHIEPESPCFESLDGGTPPKGLYLWPDIVKDAGVNLHSLLAEVQSHIGEEREVVPFNINLLPVLEQLVEFIKERTQRIAINVTLRQYSEEEPLAGFHFDYEDDPEEVEGELRVVVGLIPGEGDKRRYIRFRRPRTKERCQISLPSGAGYCMDGDCSVATDFEHAAGPVDFEAESGQRKRESAPMFAGEFIPVKQVSYAIVLILKKV